MDVGLAVESLLRASQVELEDADDRGEKKTGKGVMVVWDVSFDHLAGQ